MRPVRMLTALTFAAVVTLTGCAAHPTAVHPPQARHAPQPPPDPTGPASAPAGRQAAIYATLVGQFLTSGDDSFDERFPRIFVVLDRAIAGAGSPTRRGTATGDMRIPPAARHAITAALADVGPVAFVSSPDVVIVDRHGCAGVRDQGILVTLGPLTGMGDRVEVGLNGLSPALAPPGIRSRSRPCSRLRMRVRSPARSWRRSDSSSGGMVVWSSATTVRDLGQCRAASATLAASAASVLRPPPVPSSRSIPALEGRARRTPGGAGACSPTAKRCGRCGVS